MTKLKDWASTVRACVAVYFDFEVAVTVIAWVSSMHEEGPSYTNPKAREGAVGRLSTAVPPSDKRLSTV